MNKYLFPSDGEGKEIFDYLKNKLSIPDNAASFVVTFKHDSPVTVNCEYCPAETNKE